MRIHLRIRDIFLAAVTALLLLGTASAIVVASSPVGPHCEVQAKGFPIPTQYIGRQYYFQGDGYEIDADATVFAECVWPDYALMHGKYFFRWNAVLDWLLYFILMLALVPFVRKLYDTPFTIRRAIGVTLAAVLIWSFVPPLISMTRVIDTGITPICKDQARLLVPKTAALITLYQGMEYNSGSQVIAEARTVFNIPLQRITFDSLSACENGTTHSIEY